MARKANEAETEVVETATPVEAPATVETPVAPMPEPITSAKTGIFSKIPKAGIAVGVAVVALVILLGILIGGSGSKNVFKKTITKSYKEVVKYAKEADKINKDFNAAENAIYVSGDVKVELESDGEDMGSAKFNYNAGISAKDEKGYFEAELEGSKEKVNVEALLEDGYAYLKSSLFDEVVNLSDEISEEDLDMIFEALKTSKDVKATDATDVGQYVVDAIVKNLDPEKIESEKTEVELGEKTIKVNKVSYDLSGKSLGKLTKATIETLIDNDKFLEKTVDLVNEFIEEDDNKISKKDFKDMLKEIKDEAGDINIEEKLAINIYTKGMLNKVVGYSVSVKGKDYVSYLFTDKNIEFVYDNHDEDYREKYSVIAEKEKKEWNVTVKNNKETVATAVVRELSEEKIDLDAKINVDDDESAKVSVYFTKEQKKKTISGEYKLEATYEENKVKVSGNYNVEVKDEIEQSFDTKDAVEVDEIDEDTLAENIEKIKDDEILESLIGDELEEIFGSNTSYNSYDMKPIYYDNEVEKVASKKKAVLYVGSTYYSSYSEPDAANLFKNLVDLQKELGFHSYYLSYYYAEDETLESISKDAESTCKNNNVIEDAEEEVEENTETETEGNTETETEENTETETEENTETETEEEITTSEPSTSTTKCADYPAIYLIKDGKVVKVIKGSITKEELKQELKNIGI